MVIGRNVVLRGDATLEEGEIEDDDIVDDTCRSTSMEIRSENLAHVSSTSLDGEREREVDRIIREVQEAADKPKFTSVISAENSMENVNSDDEDALRLAVLNTRDKRFAQRNSSHEAEEGEIIDGYCVMPKSQQQLGKLSSSRQTWMQLKPRQNNRSQRYIDVQNCIKNSKFHETALPLKVTVRNDSVNGSCCVLNNQQKTFSRTSIMEMETNTKQISNPFEEQLHRLRLRVEASKFSKRIENLGDNYDQVGMDIVDSDRDSRAQSSPASPLASSLTTRPHEMQSRHGIPSDSADKEEDVDQLRAELLEQIMKKKIGKRMAPLKSSLEECELSSANSDEQVAHGSNERPSYRTETRRSNGFTNVAEQNRKSVVDPKRSRRDDSLSSGSYDGAVQDYRIKSSRKRKNFSDSISKRLRWKSKDEFGDSSSLERRNAEDWERLIDTERKMLKEIERKLRHRDDQKSITRRKRDSFLERANRYARQLGVLDAEMEMLRCDQEKAKGRFSYLERQLNKAQAEENCRDRERKTFEKEKRVEGLMEAESMKNTNKDIGYVYDPQLMVKLKSNAQGSRLTKAGCIVVSEPLSKTAPMDKTDGGDDISRPISSSGSQSSIDILGDSDMIELSDSSDSVNGLITAMCELEQEELGNFVDETATANTSGVHHEGQIKERKISRTVTLSEKDANELKNNPLIMFNGYRISPTFPYRLIAHRALSNKMDPLKPLCYYELLGRCADATCSMQHEEDYLLSDEELICSVLTYCPKLCPPKKMFSEYAREILKEQEAKPVGEIIENLLKNLPDTERRIRVCEMAAKCRPPSKRSSKDDESIEYEVPQQFQQSWL